MEITINDVVRYARGECSSAEAAQIREYLVQNPDLIIRVIAEKRCQAMRKLNIAPETDTVLPPNTALNIANVSFSPKQCNSLLDSLLSLFKKEREKIFEKNVAEDVTFDPLSHIGDKENKTTNNFNNMETTEIKITDTQLLGIDKAARELMEKADANRSTLHNMMASLLAAFPEMTPDQADKACRELLKGVSNFNNSFDALKDCSEEEMNTKLYDEMTAAISDMAPDKQANAMANFIALIRTMDAKNLSNCLTVDDANAVAQFNDFLKDVKPVEGAEVTPEMLDALRAQLKEVITNNTIGYTGIEECKTAALEVGAKGEADFAGYVQSEISSADQTAYLSLAALVAAKKGMLSGVPADVDPTLLGASVAAGKKRQEVIGEGIAGRLTWDKVNHYIKVIGGALLLALFLWVAIGLMQYIMGFTLGVFVGILGTAWPVVLVGALIGTVFAYKSILWLFKAGYKPVIDVLEKGYDIVIDFLRSGKLNRAIATVYNKVTEFFKKLFSGIKGAFQSPTVAPTVNA